jgi:hypothetical protein
MTAERYEVELRELTYEADGMGGLWRSEERELKSLLNSKDKTSLAKHLHIAAGNPLQ